MSTPLPSSFPLSDWQNYGRWLQAPLSGAFWSHWHESEPLKCVIDHPFSGFLFIHGHTIIHKPDQKFVDSWLENLLKNDHEDKTRQVFEQEAQKAEARHLYLLSSTLNDEEHAKELFETYRDLVGLWSFAILIDEALSKHLREKRGETVETLLHKTRSLPKRTTWLEQETIDLKKVAKASRSSTSKKEIEQQLQEHVDKYTWFGTHHWEGPAYTLEAARTSLNDILAKPSSTPPDQKDASLLEDPAWRWFETSLYWRTHSAELTAAVVFASRERLTNIAKRFGITYADLIQCSASEIAHALTGQGALSDETIRTLRRTEGYGCIVDDQHTEYMFQGPELQAWMHAVEEPLESSSANVVMKGTVASLGPTIEGKARVILSPRDLNLLFENGDILIAFETTPDYVPLMKRAGAIITEHGGITSHAAIVARELSKPCIIGVKNITRLVKDGDHLQINTQENTIHLL